MSKTTVVKNPGADRDWIVVDAAGQPLGRLAAQISNILRGKNRPTFTPHVDTGGFVVVVNAAKVRLTGRKDEQKTYDRFSGYRGGLKTIPVSTMRERYPDRMIHLAVRGMLPKNAMSRKLRTRLKVYAGPDHPHAAQKVRRIDK
jgi:large subunit ribosomal protein L13